MTNATVKLNNYRNAYYIPIVDGDIVIWDSYGYLRHSTNLTSYEDFEDQTEAMTKVFTNDHRTQVISTDSGHIRKLVAILKVHHRDTRSINLIGQHLKSLQELPTLMVGSK